MKFHPNEELVWVSGNFCNPRKISCVFLKVSTNPEKIIVEVASPMGFKMKRVVCAESVIRKPVEKE